MTAPLCWWYWCVGLTNKCDSIGAVSTLNEVGVPISSFSGWISVSSASRRIKLKLRPACKPHYRQGKKGVHEVAWAPGQGPVRWTISSLPTKVKSIIDDSEFDFRIKNQKTISRFHVIQLSISFRFNFVFISFIISYHLITLKYIDELSWFI